MWKRWNGYHRRSSTCPTSRTKLKLVKSVNHQEKHGHEEEQVHRNFLSVNRAGGRRLKYLTVAEHFSHESAGIVVDFGIFPAHTSPLSWTALSCFAGTRRRCEPTTARSSPAGHSWTRVKHMAFAPS